MDTHTAPEGEETFQEPLADELALARRWVVWE